MLRLYNVASPPVRVGSLAELASYMQDGLVRDRAEVLAGFLAPTALLRPARLSATDWQASLAQRLNARD